MVLTQIAKLPVDGKMVWKISQGGKKEIELRGVSINSKQK